MLILNRTFVSCSDINECVSSPCVNNGTCNDLVNKFRCTCVRGFTGRNCETGKMRCVASTSLCGQTFKVQLPSVRSSRLATTYLCVLKNTESSQMPVASFIPMTIVTYYSSVIRVVAAPYKSKQQRHHVAHIHIVKLYNSGNQHNTICMQSEVQLCMHIFPQWLLVSVQDIK